MTQSNPNCTQRVIMGYSSAKPPFCVQDQSRIILHVKPLSEAKNLFSFDSNFIKKCTIKSCLSQTKAHGLVLASLMLPFAIKSTENRVVKCFISAFTKSTQPYASETVISQIK